MATFLLRRTFSMLSVLVLLTFLIFGIVQSPPGDYVDTYIASLQARGDLATPEDLEAIRKSLGLEASMPEQYVRWITRLLKGDLGFSLENRRPVIDLVRDRLPLTAMLAVATLLFTWTLAIPIGIISAVKQYSFTDHLFTFLSYLGIGTPNFLLALVLMWVAFVYFGWNVGGLFSREFLDAPWSWARFVDLMKHLWIPVIVIGTDGMAGLVRVMRANLLDELSKPYVVTARTKGLSEWRIIAKYPVRLAINPFISVVGWSLPRLMSAGLIVSVVLSLPTLDPLLLEALFAQDYLFAGTILMIISVLTVVGTFVSDILLAIADPRIRIEA